MRNPPVLSRSEDWPQPTDEAWPSEPQMAALRAYQDGLDARGCVERYLPQALRAGRSARGVLGEIRRMLVGQAERRHRTDLRNVLLKAGRDRRLSSRALQFAIDALAKSLAPVPIITDEVEKWLAPRISKALRRKSIHTLADLTVRIPRRRGWWRRIDGLGIKGARTIEAFFAAHPGLTARARALIAIDEPDLIPWERLRVPQQVDGSRGAFRAPRKTCVLAADNDYQAVQAWLQLQESPATQRAYRKEVERLMLWAILEQGRALSSLTTEDAITYRAFLRRPAPRERWVGPVAPRTSPQWRPFQGALSPRSADYALTVISALYRFLIEKRYLLANPFAGVRVKAARARASGPAMRSFSEHEWSLVRRVADGLVDEGWTENAAERLRFVLDFAYATGLRSSELVAAKLEHIDDDERGDRWIVVVGKGNKAGRVAIPPQARLALDRYLASRGIATSPQRWRASEPLLENLTNDGAPLAAGRLWAIVKRFFVEASDRLVEVNNALAQKLRRASPHWMRHAHATFALGRGASLTTVRDNLRHASLATTSMYLHTDEVRRASELAKAFGISAARIRE